MPLFDPILPLRYVKPLLDFLHTCDPARVPLILERAGWDGACGDGPDRALKFTQFDRLLVAASELLGRDDIGFELGMRLGVESHEGLSALLENSPTLDNLLRSVERYSRLITPAFTRRYRRGEPNSEFLVGVATGMSQGTLQQALEMHAVSIYRDLSRLLGASSGLRIAISTAAPKHLARFRALSRDCFQFEVDPMPGVRVTLPTALLDRPLTPAGAALRVDPGTLNGQLRAIEPTRRIASWVTLILQQAEGVQPSLRDFAELLNASPRTVTRMLSAEGVDLRRLALQIRHQRAIDWLTGSAQPVQEIAGRLGYANATSFILAFKRMSGQTPNDYRQCNRSQWAVKSAEPIHN